MQKSRQPDAGVWRYDPTASMQPVPHFGKFPGIAKLLGVLILPVALSWSGHAGAQSVQLGDKTDSFHSRTQGLDFSQELAQVMDKCPQRKQNKGNYLTVGNGSMVSVELHPNGWVRIRNTQSHLTFLLDQNGSLKELKQFGRPIQDQAELSRYRSQIQETMQWFVTEKAPQSCTSDPLQQLGNAFSVLSSEVDRLERMLLVKDPDEAQEITDMAVQVQVRLSERKRRIQEYLETIFQRKADIKAGTSLNESDLEAITLVKTEISGIYQDLMNLRNQSYSSELNDQELRDAVQRLETIGSENMNEIQRIIQQCYIPKPDIKEQIQRFQEARQASSIPPSWESSRYNSEDY